MTFVRYAIAAFGVGLIAPQATADVPDWLIGSWQARAQVTAPDGQSVRIRCTLEAGEVAAEDWHGALRCASVQSQFRAEWAVALENRSASGNVTFTRPEEVFLDVSGDLTATQLELRTSDGQVVAFSDGADGGLDVDMTRLGPQRLTGRIAFVKN